MLIVRNYIAKNCYYRVTLFVGTVLSEQYYRKHPNYDVCRYATKVLIVSDAGDGIEVGISKINALLINRQRTIQG